MILLRDLTKLEKEKLLSLQDEIMLQWRRRKAPIIRYADGTVERRPPRAPWPFKVIISGRRSLGLVALIEGLTRDMAMSWATPGRALMDSIALRAMQRGAITINSERCPCTDCRAGRGEIPFSDPYRGSTTVRKFFPSPLPDKPLPMPAYVQANGPPHNVRRETLALDGFGHFVAGEPGEESKCRDDSKFLFSIIEQAERNREMQYDERTWEI